MGKGDDDIHRIHLIIPESIFPTLKAHAKTAGSPTIDIVRTFIKIRFILEKEIQAQEKISPKSPLSIVNSLVVGNQTIALKGLMRGRKVIRGAKKEAGTRFHILISDEIFTQAGTQAEDLGISFTSYIIGSIRLGLAIHDSLEQQGKRFPHSIPIQVGQRHFEFITP